MRGEIQLTGGQIEHQKPPKSQKNSKTQKFYEVFEFSNVWLNLTSCIKLLSVLYAKREVMSHQCDYSLLDILIVIYWILLYFGSIRIYILTSGRLEVVPNETN